MVIFDFIAAIFTAIFNICYTIVKGRPKIKITFRGARVHVSPESGKREDAICIHITHTGGRPITVLFPDIILPNGKILYLTPQFSIDPRKKGLEPSLAVGAQRIPRTTFQDRGKWGVTPAFPRELAPGALNEVWIKNSNLADELKKLDYSGEVSLKVCVPDASQKQHMSDEIIFDVDEAKWLHLT